MLTSYHHLIGLVHDCKAHRRPHYYSNHKNHHSRPDQRFQAKVHSHYRFSKSRQINLKIVHFYLSKK